MKNVFLAQVNFRYGDNVFVPYSVGSIQAYCQTDPEIRGNFSFQSPLFLRDEPEQVARSMTNPAVLGLSCYMWNWEYNKLLAQAVRVHHPNCLIVMGGIHVPGFVNSGLMTLGDLASEGPSYGFFREHPYVDIVVHGEGEIPFSSVLLESLSTNPDYTKIDGLSVRVERNLTLKTALPVRIKDLSILPSPYLTGIYDDLISLPFLWNVSQETNRGCPYPCTFCAWGPAYQQKLYLFDEARILEEFEWFGKNRVEFIFNCDSNWGILERDLSLTEKLVETRSRYGGYPRKFRMCTAKNSNDRVFDITRALDAVGMNKGATLSFQSMDEQVLENVKRRNMRINDFAAFMGRYREAGIATYTEIIMGLPGETYESFKHGIDKLVDAGQHSGLNNYVCLMLPNDEMSDPAYVAKFGIRSVRMPILLAHSTPGPDLIQEYQDVVIATNSMPEKDWRRIFLFSWAVQCFHCLGLTQMIVILLHKRFGVEYSDFYEKLLSYFVDKPETLIGQQITETSLIMDRAIQGGGRLDLVLPVFGDIYWPLEEATFLSLATNKARLYGELQVFVSSLIQESWQVSDSALIEDLFAYQSILVIDPYIVEASVQFRFDLHGYFYGTGEQELAPKRNQLKIKADTNFAGDLKRYACEVVWYGRKGGRFYHSNVVVEYQ